MNSLSNHYIRCMQGGGENSAFYFSPCLSHCLPVSSVAAVAAHKQPFVAGLVSEGWAGGWGQLHSVPPCQDTAQSDPPDA